MVSIIIFHIGVVRQAPACADLGLSWLGGVSSSGQTVSEMQRSFTGIAADPCSSTLIACTIQELIY